MSTSTISPEQALKRIDFAVRGFAIMGMITLTWFEIQTRFFPNLLPSPGWHPASTFDKWIGIGIDAFDLAAVLCAVFFSPICAYISFRASRHQKGQSQWRIDLAFVVIFYVFLVVSLSAGALSH